MNSDYSGLSKHFDYWDDFISRWLRCDMPCCEHLPEPYWGWTPHSGKPLHSVVINLNPGKGGEKQTRGSISEILSDSSFSKALGSSKFLERLSETHHWHTNRRAIPILSEVYGFRPGDDCISNHLSVELSPFHSTTSASVEGYVADHLEYVVSHSLLFAAEAAHCVDGPLHDIVIVRCSANRFLRLFKSLNPTPVNPMQNQTQSPYRFRFEHPGFENTEFICVWGAWNHIPTNDIKEIKKISIV